MPRLLPSHFLSVALPPTKHMSLHLRPRTVGQTRRPATPTPSYLTVIRSLPAEELAAMLEEIYELADNDLPYCGLRIVKLLERHHFGNPAS